MKTAISVPDGVFERVERGVKALGVSRSEFFTRAAERYLSELEHDEVTARLDAVITKETNTEQLEWARGSSEMLGASDDAEGW